jgi:hypothetical protein
VAEMRGRCNRAPCLGWYYGGRPAASADQLTIDLNGPSARVADLQAPGEPPQAQLLTARKTFTVTAAKSGRCLRSRSTIRRRPTSISGRQAPMDCRSWCRAPQARRSPAHRNCTDASHDLALGQMPVANQPLAAIIGLETGLLGEKFRNLGLDRPRQQRTRAATQNFGERIGESPGWASWKTLVSVTAYHSFGGEVEARTPPRYTALPLHAVTNFRP